MPKMYIYYLSMECMFTAQGPSVLHAIEVAVVQFAHAGASSEI